ncbi:MAG: hypothetical protein R3E79_01880 [Caldilineaceae bacterium]
MAKQKSKKRASRDVATPARPVPANSHAAASNPVAPKTAGSSAPAHWAWTISILLIGALLIGGAIFFLRDTELTVATAQPAAVAEAATPTPAPTAPSRPDSAPPGIVDYCKRSPLFRDTEGFSTRSVLSTAERGVKGAIMVEVDENGQVTRNYQHPSWDDAGYLGHVVLDRGGNLYTFPAPYVSLIDNPPELQNIIYRIDSTTAELTRFYTLTAPALPTGENPFGIMGLAYDCDTESLYASSVAGSTRAETLGQIVRLDLATREVRFRYEGVDAFGMGLYIGPTGKRLYYGLTRTPEIYSIGVDDAGNLLDDIRLEITLPDPSLKARRLIFATDGSLQVRSRPFDFNLIVTSERPEVLFTYQLDEATQQWQLVQP